MRGLIVALQYFTRLPTPALDDWRDGDLARAAPWLPSVGLAVGGLAVAGGATAWLLEPELAALGTVLVWIWVTGGLHLDGLADTADGLGAVHRDPQRFLRVARDPHTGSFGVIAIVVVLLIKWQALSLALTGSPATPPTLTTLAAIALVPAIARTVALWSAASVPALDDGRGATFRDGLTRRGIGIQAVLFVAVALALNGALLIGLVLAAAFAFYWRRRLGGVSGDVLGATIEVSEAALLVALVAWPGSGLLDFVL